MLSHAEPWSSALTAFYYNPADIGSGTPCRADSINTRQWLASKRRPTMIRMLPYAHSSDGIDLTVRSPDRGANGDIVFGGTESSRGARNGQLLS